jgi:hypothetical protein
MAASAVIHSGMCLSECVYCPVRITTQKRRNYLLQSNSAIIPSIPPGPSGPGREIVSKDAVSAFKQHFPDHEDNCLYRRFQPLLRCRQGTPYKWLNLEKLCHLLLPQNEIVRIKYFTAIVGTPLNDPAKPTRQLAYLRALKTEKLDNVSGASGRRGITRT